MRGTSVEEPEPEWSTGGVIIDGEGIGVFARTPASHTRSIVQRKLEVVKPDKEPWRSPACWFVRTCVAHDATRPQRLWLIGTPGRDRHRLRVQVRTQSKSIECSFNVVSIVLSQCRFNVVYSADRP